MTRVGPACRVAILALALLMGIAAALAVGEHAIAPQAVWQALLGKGRPDDRFIVGVLRLPRTLTAALVGAGLAVSGVVLQAVTRNPLAAPDVVGVTAGGSLAAVALIVLAPSAPQALIVPAAAAGALAGATPALLVAVRRGGSSIEPIVVGIGVGAVSQALVSLMLTYGQVAAVGEALVWMAGSVYARGFEHLRPLALWVGLLAPLACLLARHLDALEFGEDVARGLGLRVARLRGTLLALGVGLAGAAVAAAGTVGFVGLLAPHMARRVAGVSHRHLVPAAALIGALVTVLADTLGRTVFAPFELPCGVVTAAVGAPYLIARLVGGAGR